MNDETIVQNDVADATDHKKQCSDHALVGKIARLPKSIREEFNYRIDDGQPGPEILPWVNGLPEVKKILDKHFKGVPISDANLSQWRRVGFKRWQAKQESLEELKFLAEEAKDFSDVTGGNLARGAASIAAAKILKLLHTIPPEQASIDELTKISYAVTALMNAEQAQVRLKHEETRVFQGNERLVLSWDKFLRSRVETAQRALEDAICKDIQAADIDNGEKIELLGHELFGKKWQGREVGKKEETKKDSGESTEPGKTDAQERVPTTGQGHSAEGKKTDVQTADQQVRPTTVQGHSTEGKKTDATEMKGAEPVEPQTSAVEDAGKRPEDNGGDFTIAATKKKEKGQEDLKRDGEPVGRPAGSEISGGLTNRRYEADRSMATNPKQKPPVPEDPSVPKPSPWDAFSEPVKPSPFASLGGLLRSSSWKNTLG
ncbi:MAG TPA: hypothetical protein VNU95_01140 [Candidatus Acidoferrales bacterium]|jgi:hypothetical protein|nr:hypothetical protein [Candidatus Acidoferrales bacterium]